MGGYAGRVVKPRKVKPNRNAVQGASQVGRVFGGLDAVQPVTPGSDITRAKLDQLARSAVEQKYGFADQQLGQQYAQSAGMEQKIPQWFDYYRQQVQQLGLADAAARQAAQNEITGIGTTLAGATVQAASADQAAMQKDAAIRGATIDPSAYTRAIQAGNVNVANLGNQAALQTQLGFNSGQYWRGQEDVSEKAKIQQLLGELAYRRGTLDPQGQQLAREKGAFGQTFRQDTIGSERQAVLEDAAFGLNKQKAKSDAAAKAAGARSDAAKYSLDFAAKHGVSPDEYAAMSPAQRARSDRRFKKTSTPKTKKAADEPYKYGYTKKEWMGLPLSKRRKIAAREDAKDSAGSGHDSFGNTPKQRRAANDSLSRAVMMARTTGSKDVKQIRDFLVFKNVNPVVASAAAQMTARGWIDSKTARKLRRRGVTSGYTTVRPTPKPAPAPKPTGPLNPWTIESPKIGG